MEPSARIYSRFNLNFYDFIVLVISNRFAWKCSTNGVLLPLFQQHIGERAHLDVGVGTGYYVASSTIKLAKVENITLLDLNHNTLDSAASRLRRAGYKGNIDRVEQSVFSPLPDTLHGRFDAISLFYLFHCLPGAFPTKAEQVLDNLVPVLAPGGVLYGATILGTGVQHNWLGTRLMSLYNKKGIFTNKADSVENLEKALRSYFEDVKLRIVGKVAIFEARGPIRK